jgi:hypothetical protein
VGELLCERKDRLFPSRSAGSSRIWALNITRIGQLAGQKPLQRQAVCWRRKDRTERWQRQAVVSGSVTASWEHEQNLRPSIEILERDENEHTEFWSHIIKIMHTTATGRLQFLRKQGSLIPKLTDVNNIYKKSLCRRNHFIFTAVRLWTLHSDDSCTEYWISKA